MNEFITTFGIGLNSWSFWMLAALCFFIVEIFTPGFFIATFGVGALCAAFSTIFSPTYHIPLIVFSISTTITFIFIRPIATKYFFKKTPPTPTNASALIGKKGKVIERIDVLNTKGRVKIGGEDWKAISLDESIIEVDNVVEITDVDGAKVIVKKPE